MMAASDETTIIKKKNDACRGAGPSAEGLSHHNETRNVTKRHATHKHHRYETTF